MKSKLLPSLIVLNILLTIVALIVVSSLARADVLGSRSSSNRTEINVVSTSTLRGILTVGTSTIDGVGPFREFIDTAESTFKGLIIRRVAGQSVNLLEFQDADGTVLTSFNSSGAITLANLFASGTLAVGTSGSNATSTIYHNLNILTNGNAGLSFNNARFTATTTITLAFASNAATSSVGLTDFRVPYRCKLGEVTLYATSTNVSGFRTVVDLLAASSTQGGSAKIFNSLYSSSGYRVDLGVSQTVSSTKTLTAFATTTLDKDMVLRARLFQRDEKDGLYLQILCAYSPFE